MAPSPPQATVNREGMSAESAFLDGWNPVPNPWLSFSAGVTRLMCEHAKTPVQFSHGVDGCWVVAGAFGHLEYATIPTRSGRVPRFAPGFPLGTQ